MSQPHLRRILVIDDDPLMLRSLRDVLEVDGHFIVTAEGGQAGIETFHSMHRQGQALDVVITDLGMPGTDGRQVALAIKELQPRLCVILLTGSGQRMASEGDMPPGVDRILNKPPRLGDLRAALAQLPASG
jgi:CheY-like chemotaxis protein